ncbi:MAG: MFS transporter [Gemmatimonadaceae bacterium]|nr:MFS transporter [Chitinophagaceae bacterium]
MFHSTIQFFKNRPALSIGFLFSTGSLLLGIFVAAIPTIRDRLSFTTEELGFSLMIGALGALTGVALSSSFFSRVLAGRWLFIGHMLLPLIYIIQIYSPTRLIFWLALFANGLVGFFNGVSTNSIVDLLEKKSNQRIMSTCHGMYSLGGGVSAGLAALFFLWQIPVHYQISIVAAAIILTIIFIFRKDLLAHKVFIHSGAGVAMPPRSILGLSFICFVSFMGEGCIADWSAIYLGESLGSNKSMLSLGYAGFSAMMAIGRFNGDNLIAKTGARKLVVSSCLIAGAGFGLVVLAGIPVIAIAGFTMVGVGLACVVPVLFSAAANVKGISPVVGIASVASGGLLGFLAGPPAIGIVAHEINMATGLGFVGLLIIIAAIVASKNKFLGANMSSPFIELT